MSEVLHINLQRLSSIPTRHHPVLVLAGEDDFGELIFPVDSGEIIRLIDQNDNVYLLIKVQEG